MNEFVARCEAAGFRQMLAAIAGAGNAASIALHRAADLRTIGTFRDVAFRFGAWHGTALMQRALGAGTGRPPER